MRNARNADFESAAARTSVRRVSAFRIRHFSISVFQVFTLSFFWVVASAIGADSISLTNVARLKTLNRLQPNRGEPFSLSGIVTMVDPDRQIFVLQDSTGALAI